MLDSPTCCLSPVTECGRENKFGPPGESVGVGVESKTHRPPFVFFFFQPPESFHISSRAATTYSKHTRTSLPQSPFPRPTHQHSFTALLYVTLPAAADKSCWASILQKWAGVFIGHALHVIPVGWDVHSKHTGFIRSGHLCAVPRLLGARLIQQEVTGRLREVSYALSEIVRDCMFTCGQFSSRRLQLLLRQQQEILLSWTEEPQARAVPAPRCD